VAWIRNCTAGFAAVSLVASSAAAAAPRSIDPLVALSVFGTSESRAAVCAAGAAQAAAAAGAAAAQAAAGPGCVLPVVDAAAAPPVVTEPAPAMAVAPAAVGGGIGALPLLLGLAAIAGIAAVLLMNDDSDGEINLPISP
jgi:hypothetical protein